MLHSHVNCQGVVHHTPDTESCIKEIARVLEDNGTASVSVYYKNIFLYFWPLLRWLGTVLTRLGAGMPGRGRKNIYNIDDIDNRDKLVRYYDGKDNPIGKCYSRKEFIRMIDPYFLAKETYLHFFPARTLPFKLPTIVYRILDCYSGFLIYVTLVKKNNVKENKQ